MLIMVISRAWICFWRESLTPFAGTGVARALVVRRAKKGARLMSCMIAVSISSAVSFGLVSMLSWCVGGA